MLTLDVEKLKDVVIVRCTGRIVRGEEVYKLKNAILSDSETRIVVLDLSEVTSMDAGGLSALVSLHHWSRSHGIQLKFVNPSEFVRETLDRTKLSSVFDISSFHDACVAIVGNGWSETKSACC
jgi:anti-anti-sigma factor